VSDPGLTVLAVDGERPQLQDLARMLRASRHVHEVLIADSAHDAVLLASRWRFDAIFLAVRMPQLDGLELARVFKVFAQPPALVFVSAFDTAAVEAFELRALDYLMKPVAPHRVEEALTRVMAESADAEPAEPRSVDGSRRTDERVDSDVVAVDNIRGGGTRLLPRNSILYFQANGDYLRIVADSGRYLLRGRLADAERRFESHGFVRVHRQYVANLRRAIEVRPLLNGTALLRFEAGSEIPVARRQVAELRRRLHT
jgi:DNA-binding LytR/AlgR family response regulator